VFEGEAKRIAEAFAVAIVSALGAALANWGIESVKERRRAAVAERAEQERTRAALRGERTS
jgi:hypothetical protein